MTSPDRDDCARNWCQHLIDGLQLATDSSPNLPLLLQPKAGGIVFCSYHDVVWLYIKVADRLVVAKLVNVLDTLEDLVHALPCKLEVEPGTSRLFGILGHTQVFKRERAKLLHIERATTVAAVGGDDVESKSVACSV